MILFSLLTSAFPEIKEYLEERREIKERHKEERHISLASQCNTPVSGWCSEIHFTSMHKGVWAEKTQEEVRKVATVLTNWFIHHNDETSLCFLSNTFPSDCKFDLANKSSLKRKTKQTRSKKNITAGNKLSFLVTKAAQ